jgi:RNA polymerase sigma factor (sigma-70 family)
LNDNDKARRFDAMATPHLDAAYNLARWLTRSPHDAEDVVQEAYLRAYRFFDGFKGGDGRAWLFAIVRNTFYTWVQQNRRTDTVEYNEADVGIESVDADDNQTLHTADPEILLLRAADQQLVEAALLKLPDEYREILVLRELEELSYKQIADIAGIALGTVMSRLSRARAQLRRQLEAMEPQ